MRIHQSPNDYSSFFQDRGRGPNEELISILRENFGSGGSGHQCESSPCEHDPCHHEECKCHREKGCAPIPCSCRTGIRAALLAILEVVKHMPPGFSVYVEITLENGIIHTIPFGDPRNPVMITDTTLINNDLVISICDISKIHVLSGTITDPSFDEHLLEALRRISDRCQKRCEDDCCCEGDGLECAQDLQRFLCKHMDEVVGVTYDGGRETIQQVTVPTNIEYTDVVGDVSITTTGVTVVRSSSISTTSTPVIETVTPAITNVVTSVGRNNLDVLVDITTIPVNVSAPITSTPTTVITDIDTTTVPGGAVYGLTATTAEVIDVLDQQSGSAVTGFQTPTTFTGVISGLTAVSSVTPTPTDIPIITGPGVGPLIVTINGTDYPVTAGGFPVTYLGHTTIFGFPSTANFLGGVTGTPVLRTITQQGAPITGSFLTGVTYDTTDVTQEVNFGTIAGQLVTNYTSGTVGSVTSPTTTSVLRNVTGIAENIDALGVVSTIPASSLFSTTTTDVLDSASINNTPTSVLSQASLNITPQNVVESIDTTTISISAPTIEDIDGNVDSIGCGIMAVDNDNGDVSVYSVCNINSATDV